MAEIAGIRFIARSKPLQDGREAPRENTISSLSERDRHVTCRDWSTANQEGA
jgi:hypothetical protein